MKKGYLIALVILLVLTLLSLGLNGVVIYGALQAQQTALETVRDTRAVVKGIGNDSFSYTFRLRDEIPFQTAFPVNEEFTVPVHTTIPVNTTVVVPINLGFASYKLKVPINTVFPVDMEFTVPISMEMDVDVTVPVDMEVPVDIPLADMPLIDHLNQLDASLGELEGKLTDPLGVGELGFPRRE